MKKQSKSKRNTIVSKKTKSSNRTNLKATQKSSNSRNTSVTQSVLNHLQRRGSITSTKAVELYGAKSPAKIIFSLKERGYDITSTPFRKMDSAGRKNTFAKYTLSR